MTCSGRQLLGTPRRQRENITVQDEDEYGHRSLPETLVSKIKTRTFGPTEELAISLGIDGVLIAAKVIEAFMDDINCVGIWCGHGKLTNFNKFMRTTVDKLKVLQEGGLNDEHFTKTVRINLKYIIAD